MASRQVNVLKRGSLHGCRQWLCTLLLIPLVACAAEPENPNSLAPVSKATVQPTATTQEAVAQPIDASEQNDSGRQLFNDGGQFDLYADNRAQGIPNAISADFMALAYSQIRQNRIASVERESLIPSYTRLLEALELALQGEATASAMTAHNQQFIAVLQALSSGKADRLGDNALSEYQLVLDAQVRVQSPLWGWMIDYTQFKPRGRYSEHEALAQYYRSFRYASQLLLPVVAAEGTGVDQAQAQRNAEQALQLSTLLQGPSIAPLYAELVQSLEWQFGAGEDLRAVDVLAATKGREAAQYADALRQYAIQHNRVPRVLSTGVTAGVEASAAHEALIGWRLLPASVSAGAAAFQQLVYQGGDALTLDCETCRRPPLTMGTVSGVQVKAYPSYRELLQLLGSETAKVALEADHEHAYSAYNQALSAADAALQQTTGIESQQWAVMQAWIAAASDADESWQHMADTGAAGFWVWQKYLSQLYQKQSHTALAKGVNLDVDEARPGASVWPFSEPFTQLALLAKSQAASDPDGPWQAFAALSEQCATLAGRTESLTTEDEHFLNELDLALEDLGAGGDKPIVVDLHTHTAEGQVLSAGLGAPVQWRVEQARGARFNLYEFKVAMNQRMTDAQWRQVVQQAAFSDRSLKGTKP